MLRREKKHEVEKGVLKGLYVAGAGGVDISL